MESCGVERTLKASVKSLGLKIILFDEELRAAFSGSDIGPMTEEDSNKVQARSSIQAELHEQIEQLVRLETKLDEMRKEHVTALKALSDTVRC